MNKIHYEAVIIGFGKGGKTLAAKLGKEGKRVALIEKDKNMYGGTCINVGCIPSKSLINSASQACGDGPDVLFTWQGSSHCLKADAVLTATGRVPNTEGLNCEAAGIELTPRGAVKVDELLRTTASGIWAMGDVTGGLQHTYVSLDDSRIIWSQITGNGFYTVNDRKNVPYSVFLSTPYSRVGLNEQEAKAAGYRVKIASLPAAAIPKAQVLKKPEGILKAVLDEAPGRILGAMLLCQESYEMINLVKMAMDFGGDYRILRDRIYTHPTMTEAFNDLF